MDPTQWRTAAKCVLKDKDGKLDEKYDCALELDHIDGNNKNNTLKNLRWLCPNCHSMTSTWRGRNKKAVIDASAAANEVPVEPEDDELVNQDEIQ